LDKLLFKTHPQPFSYEEKGVRLKPLSLKERGMSANADKG